MEWIQFTGSWRVFNDQVEKDVREAVREVLSNNKGVLTGGATGVDYFAMDEALKNDPTGKSLLVVIPAYLYDYVHDYQKNWLQAPIVKDDIDKMADILYRFKALNPEGLIEMPYKEITQEHYDFRSKVELGYAKGLYTFHVNNSYGTQYTIDLAKMEGVPHLLDKKYTI
jgi:hypothetical protein